MKLIHGYQIKDLNIILDIHSGSVHIVDDGMYEAVLSLEEGLGEDDVRKLLANRFSEQDIEEMISEIKELTNRNELFTKDTYEGITEKFKDRETVVKALCLHVAHDCNLACKYCFAGEGEYHGERSLMSLEVGMKAIDFLIQNSGSRRNLEVDFFGGEPLMNFEVVKEIVRYAKSIEAAHNKNFRFTITTNGVLLKDDVLEFINDHMYNVVLSIDGRREVHDRMRPTPNGKGSYELILNKFKQVANSRNQENYYVRGTFTHHNLDFAADVMHLADQGFKQISVEPVVAPLTMDYAIQPDDIDGVLKEYEALAEMIASYKDSGRDFNFFHFMIDLSGGPCAVKRVTGCGSGTEYLAVTPEGDLYPCHQFVGIDEMRMGSVDKGIERFDLQAQFKACNVYSKEECKNCFAKFYCGGGCSANAYHLHGNINTVSEIACEFEKKRVECAIYLKAKEASE